MYQLIVVGTDGSETATVAVNHAVRLAKLTGATLHIVHAYRTVSTSEFAAPGGFTVWADNVEGVNEGIVAESEFVCARAARGAELEGIKVETHARPGDAADVIVEVAEELGADLVVVGNRGMTGARRFILGSVPNKVSHHCPCNLLIVETTPA
jgi:nucleotide-binding universal stress UspA family protein